MLDVIRKAIKKEMQQYANELQNELTEKHLEEFEKRMTEHRNKVVLDVISRLKMESNTNPEMLETVVHIKL